MTRSASAAATKTDLTSLAADNNNHKIVFLFPPCPHPCDSRIWRDVPVVLALEPAVPPRQLAKELLDESPVANQQLRVWRGGLVSVPQLATEVLAQHLRKEFNTLYYIVSFCEIESNPGFSQIGISSPILHLLKIGEIGRRNQYYPHFQVLPRPLP